MRKQSLLYERAAGRLKGVALIVGPATRKIMAIFGIIAAGHANFVSVVELRDAAQCRARPNASFCLAMELPAALKNAPRRGSRKK